VGGTASGAGNVISGNGNYGVNIYGLSATGNLVQGNTIGLAAGGATVLGNAGEGIAISDAATGNTIGGATSGAGNVISGNGDDGVAIRNAGTAGNTVQGNIIGADSTGTLDRGNANDGISITSSAADNTIVGNLISGNDDQGIYLKTTSGNVVQDNLIGTAGDGVSALGNSSRGIYFYSDPSGNTIGGTAAGEGNTIAHNGNDGVGVSSGVDNAIRGNAIFANSGLGIDLSPSGVTANDTGDGDSGANNLQNFPVLSAAHSNGSTTTITGTLNSSASTQFALDFYASDSCDASGNGEGERYLGSDTVTTDGSGDASFISVVSAAVADGESVTATATDPQGNTSEFSACVVATYAASLQADFSATPVAGAPPLAVTFTDTSTPAGAADAWAWDFGDGGTSAAQHPVYTYTVTGIYTVTLTVTDTGTSQTSALSRTNYITVSFTSTWETITTTTAPPVSGEYAMAYDGARDVVVLYGGNAGGWPYSNSTWEFNGTDWAQVATATQPAAVYGMAMAYDASRGVVVLFGGSDATDEELAGTWEYNGTSWTQATPTASPPARTGAGLAYDAAGQTLYLFGGNDETTYYGDLWQYNGTTWSQVTPATAPPARTLHDLAYDASEGNLYLFGGRDTSGAGLSDLWAFDPSGSSWSQVNESGPAARYAHSFVYDIGTASLVLIGGAANAGDTLLADTWHFQATGGWAEGAGSGGTPATAYHGAIYDGTDQRVILFQDGTTWIYR
jgi:parallel beta-helix repeat protein